MQRLEEARKESAAQLQAVDSEGKVDGRKEAPPEVGWNFFEGRAFRA